MQNYLAPLQKYLPPQAVLDAHAKRLRACSGKMLDVIAPKART